MKDIDIEKIGQVKSVSPAKLRIYLHCQRKYFLTYAYNLFPPPTSDTIAGIITHKIIEQYLFYLLENQINEDRKYLISLSEKIINQYKKEYDIFNKEIEDNIHLWVNIFISNPIYINKLYAVEKKFNCKLTKDIDVFIEGRIDSIYVNKKENKLIIVDYKTGKNKLTEESICEDIQVKIYSVAVLFIYRFYYKNVDFVFHYLRDNTKIRYSVKEPEKYIKDIIEIILRILSDKEFKRNVGQWCKYCHLFKRCKPYE